MRCRFMQDDARSAESALEQSKSQITRGERKPEIQSWGIVKMSFLPFAGGGVGGVCRASTLKPPCSSSDCWRFRAHTALFGVSIGGLESLETRKKNIQIAGSVLSEGSVHGIGIPFETRAGCILRTRSIACSKGHRTSYLELEPLHCRPVACDAREPTLARHTGNGIVPTMQITNNERKR